MAKFIPYEEQIKRYQQTKIRQEGRAERDALRADIVNMRARIKAVADEMKAVAADGAPVISDQISHWEDALRKVVR